MKDQLITINTAKLAKDKGFNIETDKYLCNYYTDLPPMKWKLLNKKELTPNFSKFEWAAPTQTQLQKWLREKHNLYVQVDLDQTSYPKFAVEVYKYDVDIDKNGFLDEYIKIIQNEWFL